MLLLILKTIVIRKLMGNFLVAFNQIKLSYALVQNASMNHLLHFLIYSLYISESFRLSANFTISYIFIFSGINNPNGARAEITVFT